MSTAAFKRPVRKFLAAVADAYLRLCRPARYEQIMKEVYAPHRLTLVERIVVQEAFQRVPCETAAASARWSGEAGAIFHSREEHYMSPAELVHDALYRGPMLGKFAELVATRFTKRGTILDVGCGRGAVLEYLLTRIGPPHDYVGIDINPVVIERNRARTSSRIQYIAADVFREPPAFATPLAVTACAVLMYSEERDIVRLLRSLTATHAQLIVGISEPCADPEGDSSPHNLLAHSHGYRRIFRELGFDRYHEAHVVEPGKAYGHYHAVFCRSAERP